MRLISSRSCLNHECVQYDSLDSLHQGRVTFGKSIQYPCKYHIRADRASGCSFSAFASHYFSVHLRTSKAGRKRCLGRSSCYRAYAIWQELATRPAPRPPRQERELNNKNKIQLNKLEQEILALQAKMQCNDGIFPPVPNEIPEAACC